MSVEKRSAAAIQKLHVHRALGDFERLIVFHDLPALPAPAPHHRAGGEGHAHGPRLPIHSVRERRRADLHRSRLRLYKASAPRRFNGALSDLHTFHPYSIQKPAIKRLLLRR